MKPLTDNEKVFCENWMKSYQQLSSHLTDKQFTEPVILMMVRYEMSTRQRKTILERLFARYFKLRKNSTVAAATKWMAQHPPELFIQGVIAINNKENGLGDGP